jgi:hypothetical protein
LPEQSLARLRILAQIFTSWLVITLQRTTRVVLLVLNPLCFQVKGGELDAFRLSKTVIAVQRCRINCNIKLWAIFICVINNGDFIHILTCCLLHVTHFYVNIDNSVDCLQPLFIFLFCVLLSHFTLFYLIYFTVTCRLYIRNSLAWLCISFNFVITFLE